MKAHLSGQSWIGPFGEVNVPPSLKHPQHCNDREREGKPRPKSRLAILGRKPVYHGYTAGDRITITMVDAKFSAIILPAGFWQQFWFLLRRGAR